ncbi:MAG: hypothetical protein FWF25_08615, partial [Propionibacteriaceae bacterium]|nr:hypothetical protein [Propionibacteriaceae bacterium]MCL2483608.1 hypothetical protein [Propionibacteriaceae bacterium]
LYRLLAIAKIADRFVIPKAHREEAAELASWTSGCPLDSPRVEMAGAAPVASPKFATFHRRRP